MKPRSFSAPGLALTVLIAAAAIPARGQNLFVEPRLSFGSDFQMGGRAGLEGFQILGDASLSVFLDGEVRMIPETVRVRMSPTLEHQYRENRFSIGPGFSIAQPLGTVFSLNAGAGLAFTDGDYSGSNRNVASGWKPWAEGGGAFDLGARGAIGAALQLRPLPEVSPVRVLVQYRWRWR